MHTRKKILAFYFVLVREGAQCFSPEPRTTSEALSFLPVRIQYGLGSIRSLLGERSCARGVHNPWSRWAGAGPSLIDQLGRRNKSRVELWGGFTNILHESLSPPDVRVAIDE